MESQTLDVGGNIGAASIFLVSLLQGRVRSVDFIEPEETNMKLAKKSLRGLTAGPGFAFHAAALVGSERICNGQVKFSISESTYNRYGHCLTEYYNNRAVPIVGILVYTGLFIRVPQNHRARWQPT